MNLSELAKKIKGEPEVPGEAEVSNFVWDCAIILGMVVSMCRLFLGLDTYPWYDDEYVQVGFVWNNYPWYGDDYVQVFSCIEQLSLVW